MRRNNFLVGALAALVTFVSLTAFVGRRPWGWHRGWRYHHCYYNSPDRHPNEDQNNRNAPGREPAHDTTFSQ